MDLFKVAAKLENEEQLCLKYRVPVEVEGGTEWVVRTEKLLDVAEDRGILYVEHNGEPLWVRIEEAMEIMQG